VTTGQFLFEVSSEVPVSVLLRGRGALVKKAEALRDSGRPEEAAALEAVIPVPPEKPIYQREIWLDWSKLPAELESTNPQILPFPSWLPAYQANMRDFALKVDSMLIHMLILPHAVYTSPFLLMLHTERPPKQPLPLSIVRPANEVARILRCMINYMQTSDRNSAAWRDHISKTLGQAALTLGKHQALFKSKVETHPLLASFKADLEKMADKYVGVKDLVGEAPPDVRDLAAAYGVFSFEYAVSVIRTLEMTLAPLLGLNLEACVRHNMFTRREPVPEALIDDVLKRHLVEEQLGLSRIVAQKPFDMDNININCVERFPLGFRGCLSHYLLFAYLEGMIQKRK
jgi:hypothetical protein